MRITNHSSRFIEMFSSRQLPLKHLPDLSENLDKKRVPITSGDRKSGKYPYYGASGIVDYVNDYIFDETLLLISEDGANLKDRVTPIAFQASGKFWVNNHAHVLRFDSSAMMLYIEYLINGMDIEKYLTGMAQPKLNQKELNAIPIPVPSDSELQRFQTLIIQADKSKFTNFKSRFIEMFGDTLKNTMSWEFRRLPEVTTIVLGSTPSSSNPDYWDGNVKWITPAELDDDSFILTDSERHITDDGVKNAGLKSFPAGTVIFSTRAPIGKTAIAGCEMYCNQGFKNFICSDILNPIYLFYTLRSHKEELQKMGTGSTFLELSKKTIESISVSVPDRALQDEFEVIYKQADKSKYLN